jgi:hypothetical protein
MKIARANEDMADAIARAIIVIVIAATTMPLQCDDNTTALRPETQGVARTQ